MRTLAVIPARGGSKGIPRKNILPLGDKPLIAHTIDAAANARTIDRIVVSTDDAEIAEVAKQFAAEVVMRPAALASDMARSEDALLHVLEELRDSEGYEPDVLVFLQCTSPFTTAADIDGTVDALVNEEADSALSVVASHYFLWKKDQSGEPNGVNHDKSHRLMRQEREPEFIETGSVYAMRVAGFLQHRFRFFGRTAMHEIPMDHWQEIDEPADLDLARQRFEHYRSRESAGSLPSRIGGLVMDFDGVLTDDRVTVSEGGEESVVCSRSDGMGIELLRKAGLPMTVISKERNKVVAARCEKLRVPCSHGIEDKLPLMQRWLADNGIAPEDAIYVGNDINDLPCMAHVGCAVAPGDAHRSAIEAADIVLTRPGGQGAIRELADLLLSSGRISEAGHG